MDVHKHKKNFNEDKMESLNKEIYRSLKELNYDDIEISNMGLARDIDSKLPIKIKIKNGRNFLEMNTRPIRDIDVDILVATYFCQNTTNKRFVKHINNNTLDDRAENLQWVDYMEVDKDLEVKDFLPIYELTRPKNEITPTLVKRWTHPENILKAYNANVSELKQVLENGSYKSKKSAFRDHEWIFASDYESRTILSGRYTK